MLTLPTPGTVHFPANTKTNLPLIFFFFPGVYIVYTVPYITLKSFPKLYTNPDHKKFTIFPLTGSGISTNNEVLNINQIGLYP